MKLTIGQLANQVGIRTSAIRYYEKQGLLSPLGRTDSGYRHYGSGAVQTLRFIQRAKRLGFSLSDIRELLQFWEQGSLRNQDIIQTAESRFLELERQVTERLVRQHELALFLTDLHEKANQQNLPMPDFLTRLLERVCSNPGNEHARSMLHWLGERTGCMLTSGQALDILENLRGQHFHIWQENESYYILVVSQDPQVGSALTELASLENACTVHPLQQPMLDHSEEGFLLKAAGPEGFLFARIFLSMEHMAFPLPQTHPQNRGHEGP